MGRAAGAGPWGLRVSSSPVTLVQETPGETGARSPVFLAVQRAGEGDPRSMTHQALTRSVRPDTEKMRLPLAWRVPRTLCCTLCRPAMPTHPRTWGPLGHCAGHVCAQSAQSRGAAGETDPHPHLADPWSLKWEYGWGSGVARVSACCGQRPLSPGTPGWMANPRPCDLRCDASLGPASPRLCRRRASQRSCGPGSPLLSGTWATCPRREAVLILRANMLSSVFLEGVHAFNSTSNPWCFWVFIY